MMSPETYEKYAVSDYEKVIQQVYSKYEVKLQRNNSVDFDDLSEVEVLDEETNEKVSIPYDTRYDLFHNANLYYKKYQKSKKSIS